jgi:hypothetical protein
MTTMFCDGAFVEASHFGETAHTDATITAIPIHEENMR